MASSVKHERPEREESCFSRAARSIRRALSRICGDSSHSSSADTHPRPIPQPDYEELDVFCESDTDYDQSDTDYDQSDTDYGVLNYIDQSDTDYDQSDKYYGDVNYIDQSDKDYGDVNYIDQSDKDYGDVNYIDQSDKDYGDVNYIDQSDTDYVPPRPHHMLKGGRSLFSRYSIGLVPLHFPPSQWSSFIQKSQKRTSSAPSFRSKKKHKTDSLHMTSTTDPFDCMLDQPPSGTLRETGVKKHGSSAGLNQDNTREMELNATAGPSILQFTISDDDDSDSAVVYDREKEWDESSGSLWFGCADRETRKYRHARIRSPPLSDPYLHLPNKKDTHDDDPRYDNPGYPVLLTCSQTPAVAAPPCPQDTPTVLHDSPVCTAGSRTQVACELSSMQSESEPVGDSDALMEMDGPVTAVNYSVTNTLPAHSHLLQSPECFRSRRDSSCLPRSHSLPSLSQITSAKNKSLTRAESLPDMLLTNSFEEFTPEMTADENDETYRFQCSCPGLYQCSVTGLVFHMEGEGDVVYRIVPWNRRLLAQHHKKPAGPLFDINCLQQSVCQLHLPHCEIRSTGGCDFLSVAHVNDEGIEFISPHKITETHVIINITGFSAFGNVKDEDSPPDLVRALVLLFYRPPADPDPESLLSVLLLPKNVVLRDVLRTRKKLVGDESYIETSPHCKLRPKQEYTLSTCPEDDSVLVQPTEAEFDCDNYDNYFPSFQVSLEKIMKHIKLFLRNANSSHSVWERRVCLSSPGVRRSCGQSALNLPPNEKLFAIRSSFIDGISGPVLKSLLDKLLEKKVINDSERESADVMQNNRDKARSVIDTVRKKGEAASSEMIEFLCEADPFLCEHLGLI
ncbi:hypothetical protein ABVT39_005849 [Epinephelus coioides]